MKYLTRMYCVTYDCKDDRLILHKSMGFLNFWRALMDYSNLHSLQQHACSNPLWPSSRLPRNILVIKSSKPRWPNKVSAWSAIPPIRDFKNIVSGNLLNNCLITLIMSIQQLTFLAQILHLSGAKIGNSLQSRSPQTMYSAQRSKLQHYSLWRCVFN